MSLLNLADIPGYAEAQKKEQADRDLAFCDWLIPLCGFKVRQFNLLHLLVLGNCDNAFVAQKIPEPEDVGFFLWVVSPEYAPDKIKERNRFLKTAGNRVQYLAGAMEINEYLRSAFQDSPHASSPFGSKNYTSFCAVYCDLFAHEYGWDDSQTMSKPIARLFQLFRRIERRSNPKAMQFNPSDALIGAWLRAANATRN